jgi:predicted tellurium resistance membrane protein TerC
MPRRSLPLTTLVLGLVAVFLALARPARGFDQGPDPKAIAEAGPNQTTYPRVRVEPAHGPTVEGYLLDGTVSVKTEIGTQSIDLTHVRRITFQRDPAGKSQDTVQLDDESLVRGRVGWGTLWVKTGDEVQPFAKADVRQVTMLREQKLSPLGIAIGLFTLSAMEIVLGIDNVIFLAIVAGRLPAEQRPRARRIGLTAALGTRILLLLSLSFLLGLTEPVFTLPDLPLLHELDAREVSWRDIILLAGGLFLIGKSVFEMHEKLEHAKAEREGQPAPSGPPVSFARTIAVIAVIDIVFSLDSVITAIGMVEHVWVMIVAMVIAMLVMLWFAGPVSDFVDRHPTIKVLALAFLILIGVMLVAEGLGQHVDKGYIYFAMAFAVVIELINLRLRKASKEKAEATAEMPKG